MYIVTFLTSIENTKNYEINVNLPQDLKDFSETTKKADVRRYHIEYDYNNEYEVCCPEYIDTDRNNVIIIPDFLAPRKKYPIPVYLYAINFYSSNQNIGQRGAAEATRKKFNLINFSHSTLCRVFRELEQVFGEYFEKSFKSGEERADHAPEMNNGGNTDITPVQTNNRNRFPSLADTKCRRIKMTCYFRHFKIDLGKDKRSDLILESQKLVKCWYDETRRLLI